MEEEEPSGRTAKEGTPFLGGQARKDVTYDSSR